MLAELRRLRAEVEAERTALEQTAPVRAVPQLVDSSFPAQTAFLEDASPLVVVLCTRRAGKSFGGALKLLRAAYQHPGSSCLYIALTRDSAKKTLWKDCLKVLQRRLSLGAEFNETNLTMTLPNGSVIYLLGVDTTEDEKEKLLGQKYATVVIDESASYTIDLVELVYGVLKPAVADYRGAITLIGTPANLKRGLYYELTRGQDPGTPGRWAANAEDPDGKWTANGWSGHRWSANDNPHMAENWRAEIAELEAQNPRIRLTPLFQQHYLGRWVVDNTKLVYRYEAGRNDWDGVLPTYRRGKWHHTLGVDLGFVDPTAFSVCAYHDHDRRLFIRRAYKRSGMDLTWTAQQIRALDAEYHFDRIVVDNAHPQALAEMRVRHELPLEPADKRGKSDVIEIMNGEFISGYVVLGPDASALRKEYVDLVWDDRSAKREEHPSCDNHCADATLYGWRDCYQFLSSVLTEAPARGSVAALQAEADALERAAEREWDEQQRLVFGPGKPGFERWK